MKLFLDEEWDVVGVVGVIGEGQLVDEGQFVVVGEDCDRLVKLRLWECFEEVDEVRICHLFFLIQFIF